MSAQKVKPQGNPAPTAKAHPQASRIQLIIDQFKREWQFYVMLLPVIIWLLVFLYKPMYGLQIVFEDYSVFRGVISSPWVGFENFETLFNNDQFVLTLHNTVYISFLSLIFAFPMPIILALMFSEILKEWYKTAAQAIDYQPHFISSVIIAGIVIMAFSPSAGTVNSALGWCGLDSIYLLTKPEWVQPIFVGTTIWQEAEFQSMIYLVVIAGVSSTLYESAVVDCASSWQMMWKITIPLIMSTIIILLII